MASLDFCKLCYEEPTLPTQEPSQSSLLSFGMRMEHYFSCREISNFSGIGNQAQDCRHAPR